MAKEVILTGIRANQDLTIGNYFGAILPMIDMAKNKSDQYQINMFIPDLHSFTTPIDHSILNKQIFDNAKLFVAAGLPLDNESIYLYRQSYIPAHSELTVVLNGFTGFGEMSRMTQFKEKSNTLTEFAGAEEYNPSREVDMLGLKRRFVSVGLFNYPVLMASDILLYNAKYVPVGDDQTQHLEFTRDIAERFNKKFYDLYGGDVFTVPESVSKQHEFFGNDQGLRIKDLIDPTKKMSKSDDSGRGVIFLNDNPDVAAKKIMGATTDDKAEINFDRENQPGISNLLEILALLRGVHLNEVIDEFKGQNRYGDFKKIVADEMRRFLADFQSKLANVDENAVMAKLEQSERDLTPIANETLLRAQRAVGLRPKG
jgi:tryptophanyl-tRNA synthetase